MLKHDNKHSYQTPLIYSHLLLAGVKDTALHTYCLTFILIRDVITTLLPRSGFPRLDAKYCVKKIHNLNLASFTFISCSMTNQQTTNIFILLSASTYDYPKDLFFSIR